MAKKYIKIGGEILAGVFFSGMLKLAIEKP